MTRLSADERSRLRLLVDHLVVCRDLAAADTHDFLSYLIEMAVMETREMLRQDTREPSPARSCSIDHVRLLQDAERTDNH